MNAPLDRRSFLHASTALLAAAALLPTPSTAQDATAPAKPPPKPPVLPPDQVRAAVAAAHGDFDGLRRLVDATPLLANACWDWGGGDFETPLEAAAHMGRRDIADYLLRQGARPGLHAAGMLGQLDLVKAFMTIDPRAHEIPGPHGFTLLHCVRQGGEPARPVLDWLLAQGVPDVAHRTLRFVWPQNATPAPA